MRATRRAPKAPAPVPKCQCAADGKRCDQPAVKGFPFCTAHAKCPLAPLSGYEPDGVSQAKRWSDFAVELAHNCYAWAMQFVSPEFIRKCREQNGNDCRKYFPQPGAKSGNRDALNAVERRTCPAVEQLMMSDVPGITKSSYYAKCPAGTSKIALVVSKGKDYHYYLQTSPSPSSLARFGWLHKDGSNPVKDFDANKQPIANPETAARDYRPQGSDLNYTDFCGFYCVPRTAPIVLAQGGSKKEGGGSKTRRRGTAKRRPPLPQRRSRKAQRFGLA
jgi:hypothetical protein